jgi:DNA-binding response OmpR family regulator
LLVEDSEDDAALVARELRRYGFVPSIERVETGEAMGAALDRAPFDVAIVDYALPRFGALPSLELIHQRGVDLPVVIV